MNGGLNITARETYSKGRTPWVDRNYTPCLQGVDNGQTPSKNAQRVIDRLIEAITPFTEELMKGFDAPENDWDATDFTKM
jgi:hypothetical protein